MEPLAGAAPARLSYKENLQAAAKRQRKWPAEPKPARTANGILPTGVLRQGNLCHPLRRWRRLVARQGNAPCSTD